MSHFLSHFLLSSSLNFAVILMPQSCNQNLQMSSVLPAFLCSVPARGFAEIFQEELLFMGEKKCKSGLG